MLLPKLYRSHVVKCKIIFSACGASIIQSSWAGLSTSEYSHICSIQTGSVLDSTSYPNSTGALSLGIEQPWHDADDPRPPSATVKHAWSCSSTSAYTFVTCSLVKHRDNTERFDKLRETFRFLPWNINTEILMYHGWNCHPHINLHQSSSTQYVFFAGYRFTCMNQLWKLVPQWL